MPLDPGLLAVIRSHVGSKPDDTDLEVRYTRLGSAEKVALEVIRGRLADMTARPGHLRVEGDYTESVTSEQLKALQAKEAELVALVAEADGVALAGVVSVARLTRGGRSR